MAPSCDVHVPLQLCLAIGSVKHGQSCKYKSPQEFYSYYFQFITVLRM